MSSDDYEFVELHEQAEVQFNSTTMLLIRSYDTELNARSEEGMLHEVQ